MIAEKGGKRKEAYLRSGKNMVYSFHRKNRSERMILLNNALEFLKARRSTRKYLDKAVPAEALGAVLEAGRYAPSGMNVQATHYLVIRNKEVLEKLAALVREGYARAGMERPAGYTFHYNPDVLVVTCNRLDNPNNQADCACALENMMLMASSLELGSCWINQLKTLNQDETVNDYMISLGMDPQERVFGALALGYADTESGLPNHEPGERKGNPVTYIE